MLTLRLVVLAVAIALVAACGTGSDQAGDSAGKETPGAGNLTLAVSWDEALVAGEPITWSLTVANQGDEPVTLVFRSGQQGDVVLTAGDGSEAYRWSGDRSFTAALVEEPVPAGAGITFELAEEALDVEPGTYKLNATVPSDPPVPPAEETITVG